MSKAAFILLAMACLTGCMSNNYRVTYASNPMGAQVYCDGIPRGYAPVTLTYTLDDEVRKQGVLRTTSCGFKWVSGVTASANREFDLREFPDGVTTFAIRPDAPNAHVDHSFALQLQQQQQMGQILQQTNAIQAEQDRLRQQKQSDDQTQFLCKQGLLNHPACR